MCGMAIGVKYLQISRKLGMQSLKRYMGSVDDNDEEGKDALLAYVDLSSYERHFGTDHEPREAEAQRGFARAGQAG